MGFNELFIFEGKLKGSILYFLGLFVLFFVSSILGFLL